MSGRGCIGRSVSASCLCCMQVECLTLSLLSFPPWAWQFSAYKQGICCKGTCTCHEKQSFFLARNLLQSFYKKSKVRETERKFCNENALVLYAVQYVPESRKS